MFQKWNLDVVTNLLHSVHKAERFGCVGIRHHHLSERSLASSEEYQRKRNRFPGALSPDKYKQMSLLTNQSLAVNLYQARTMQNYFSRCNSFSACHYPGTSSFPVSLLTEWISQSNRSMQIYFLSLFLLFMS